MLELPKKEREVIVPLCAGIQDVTLISALEGNLGKAWANNKDHPTWAIVTSGDFYFLLGNANEIDTDTFLTILSENCRGKVIVSDGALWKTKIEDCYPTNFKKFKRYKLSGQLDSFPKNKLQELVKELDSQFELKKIDKPLYELVLKEKWTSDFCCFFESYEDFSTNGIGFLILRNNEIVAGASSYTYCKGKIDITIGTKEEYRRKGLALASASKLILECLKREIYPQWDAANLGSVALAEKLGYQFEGAYTVYYI